MRCFKKKSYLTDSQVRKLRLREVKTLTLVTLLSHKKPGFESRWVDFTIWFLTGARGCHWAVAEVPPGQSFSLHAPPGREMETGLWGDGVETTCPQIST